MINNIALKVESLGKKYKIGQTQKKHDTIRDSIMARVEGLFRRPEPGGNSSEFWALKDVSFTVMPGEIVGVIGRNGAGKSTLLKTLARITDPTEGSIDIFGRVGSLLEVGTGFHLELTGKENVYLSGSILGMKKAEIDRHFDEIVDFAEVDKFIDTPVKHYSSGMYLRLAFGVAAFLQPEILLIDEVLAVGDAAFQKKCLGKMDDVAKQGRTVLFVSHNMSAVQELCQRGILIDEGRVWFDGNATDCIAEYFNVNNLSGTPESTTVHGSSPLQIKGISIDGSTRPAIETGQEFCVSLGLHGDEVKNPVLFLIIENITGQQIVHSRITGKEIGLDAIDGRYRLSVSLPTLWLAPGVYSVYFKCLAPSFSAGKVQSERLMLEVRGDFDGTGRTLLSPNAVWEIDKVPHKSSDRQISARSLAL